MTIREVNENYIKMPGVVVIVSVPTEEYEKVLEKRNQRTKSHVPKQCLKQSLIKETDMDAKPFLLKKIRHKDYASIPDVTDTEKLNSLCMQKAVEKILKQFKIENPLWTKGYDNNYIQITFTLKIDNLYEEVLDILQEYRIGSKYNSSIRVVPCILHYGSTFGEEEEDNYVSNESKDGKLESENSGWSQFLLSIRARLTVAEVVENIKRQAALTFHHMCLLFTAAIICAIGLVENNNVYLIASMLISPMMGPVMASTFGTVIRNRKLQRMGISNELLGVGVSTVIGFLCGTLICLATDKYGEVEWPTSEMITRGETRTIGVGCLIALFSGAAVAVAVLSDDISPAVGVAISTSLMPPAVNAGLLWSMASVYYLKGNETTRYSSLTYTNYYSDNRAMELTSLGTASLCLTFVNIICIYIAGILMLKIKEVAPITSRDQIRRRFWNHDIKIARDYNKNQNGDDTLNIEEDLLSEFPDYRKDILRKKFLRHIDDFHHSTDLTYGSDKIKIRRSQYTWSPCMLSETKKPTMHEVRGLYNKIVEESDPSGTLNLNTSVFNKPDVFLPFNNSIGAIQLPEEHLASIAEDGCPRREKRKKLSKKSKKFVVTPCVVDIENGKSGCP